MSCVISSFCCYSGLNPSWRPSWDRSDDWKSAQELEMYSAMTGVWATERLGSKKCIGQGAPELEKQSWCFSLAGQFWGRRLCNLCAIIPVLEDEYQRLQPLKNKKNKTVHPGLSPGKSDKNAATDRHPADMSSHAAFPHSVDLTVFPVACVASLSGDCREKVAGRRVV
jgi:hypothetical protein